jgi:trans-aconitate 2-methyltransferase
MKIRDEASAEEVRGFYQADMERRVQARIYGNIRIDRAADFLVSRINSDSRIFDLGCGIGIATERMARKASRGHVFAVDISPAHLDYCRRTIDLVNVSFSLVDVLEEFDKAIEMVGEPVDVITMVDVVEHLPSERATALFKRFPEILKPDGRILLTYPSPEYQRDFY